MTIFKANDIRGIYNESLTDEIAYRIGVAYAQKLVLQMKQVAVGRDGRLSSPMLSEALIKGLLAGGANVIDIGLVPTPALYYAAHKEAQGCGIMVTGSHNPKNHNGFKMMFNGATLKGEEIQSLYQASTDVVKPAKMQLIKKEIKADYIAEIASVNVLKQPLKVVIDAGNGAAGQFAPDLFRALGCDVIELYCEIDGNFPHHHPDPSRPENLQMAYHCLEENQADLLLAFDGDGDRLGVALKNHPPPVFSDRVLMFFAKDLLAHSIQNKSVVYDVKCSSRLADWIINLGGEPDMQPTGHAFIKTRMKETGALLGGEMSGHFFFAHQWYGFDDALFAGARFASILSHDLSAFEAMPNLVATSEINVDMTGKDQHAFIKTLSQCTDLLKPYRRLITIDGLRVEYTDGFGLVRASNTTASLVLRFEGESLSAQQKIMKLFREFLLSSDSDLKIPF